MAKLFAMSALARRNGLTNELAYLRVEYPRDKWRSYDGFGQMADHWLQIHAGLRRDAAQLQKAIATVRENACDADRLQRYLVPHVAQYLERVNGHHRLEDVALFPRFRKLDSRMAAGFDLLENDHAIIHQALVRSVESIGLVSKSATFGTDAPTSAYRVFADEADQLFSILDRHLFDEEDLVVPALLHHGEAVIM